MNPAVTVLPVDLSEIHPAIFVAFLAVLAGIAVLEVLALGRRRARRRVFVSQFGSEYLRALEGPISRRRVEQDLAGRIERRSAYDVRPLTDLERRRFRTCWDEVQRGFVDGPATTSEAAVTLVADVAAACGYPAADEETCLDDVSVDHPHLVADLRRAVTARTTLPDTDQHREVVLRARALFDRLLEVGVPASQPALPVAAGVSEVSASARSTPA